MAEISRLHGIIADMVSSPSKEITSGDRVQLQGKGELMIETAELTKKNRWRIELIRR